MVEVMYYMISFGMTCFLIQWSRKCIVPQNEFTPLEGQLKDDLLSQYDSYDEFINEFTNIAIQVCLFFRLSSFQSSTTILVGFGLLLIQRPIALRSISRTTMSISRIRTKMSNLYSCLIYGMPDHSTSVIE